MLIFKPVITFHVSCVKVLKMFKSSSQSMNRIFYADIYNEQEGSNFSIDPPPQAISLLFLQLSSIQCFFFFLALGGEAWGGRENEEHSAYFEFMKLGHSSRSNMITRREKKHKQKKQTEGEMLIWKWLDLFVLLSALTQRDRP